MAEQPYILSIDQGTTGTKALLVDQDGNIRAESYQKHTQYYPHSGWAEHDPTEIWQMVLAAVADILEKANIAPHQVHAVGLANQGETVMAWDVTDSSPLYPAIVWSCRRSIAIADQWNADHDWRQRVKEKTGLRIDPYFSATKVKWLMEEVPEVNAKLEEGCGRFGTLDTWMIWNMTGKKQFVTDASTAARTLLFNIQQGEWDEEILQYLGIKKEWLAQVVPSVGELGVTCPDHFLGIQAPIRVSMVDQPAALYGHLCVEPGMSKCTYGTGCFAYLNVGTQPLTDHTDTLLSTIVWQREDAYTYALDGAIYSAGSAIEWGMNGLGLYDSIEQLQEWSKQWELCLNGGAVEKELDNEILFIPALSGLGAPYWSSDTRGMFVGMSHDTTKQDLARAILEGIAHRIADVLEAMQLVSGQQLKSLRVDGGPTRNPYLMQVQANILGIPVEAPKQAETTAMGVAYLQGESLGWWTQEQLQKKILISRRYEPQLSHERVQLKRRRWKKAIQLLQDFQ
ncbi:glycerol kinase [Brevibacillus choshinensis]|uniref:ATP:glycerol 3-phosphotransferase n=1 Tax=Brevibacillus choshinensis TaxID=54911 RepID=A0ABR5N6D7_BRECH|nr:glycerol kinase [Brevibacillus choshinensis]KQL46161.1 glycerol kinase [Brevibacillus choshinensis]